MDTKEIYQGTSLMMTGITNIEKSKVSRLEIFPNPATDQVTLKSDSSIDKLGQLIKRYNIFGKSINFSISEVDPGIYFLKVFSHDNVITRKIVIKRNLVCIINN